MSQSESAQQETPAHPWLKDFVLTWLSRFGIFLAHHVTRPLLPLYLITFGASSTVIGAVMAVFTITATVMRIPIGLLIDRVGRNHFYFTASFFSPPASWAICGRRRFCSCCHFGYCMVSAGPAAPPQSRPSTPTSCHKRGAAS